MRLGFITFVYILSVDTLDIPEVTKTVFKNSRFETVFVLGSFENCNFEYPRIIWSNNGSTFALKWKFSRNILTIVNETELLDPIAVFLRGNLESKVLIISSDSHLLEDVVEKCRELSLQDAVIHIYGEYFAHKAYSSYVKRIEGKDIFKISLFEGFQNYLMTITDDNLWEHCEISDYCMLMKSFAKRYNVHITNYLLEDLQNPTVQMYSFRVIENYVYPMYLEMSTITFMTPLSPKVDRFYYYVLPFEYQVWIGIICTVFFITSTLTLLEFSKKGKLDFSKNFLRSLELTIHGGRVIISHNWKIYWIHGMIMVYGFIVVNVYIQFLGVYFITDASFVKEIDILCLEEFLRNFRPTLGEAGIEKLRLKNTTFDIYFSNLNSLSTNYGYCISSGMWEKKLVFQAHLKSPIFKRMDHIISAFFPRSPLFREDTIFLRLYNHYIVQMHAHGFLHKWSRGMILANYRKALIEFYQDRGGPVALSTEDLRFAWTLYLVGVAVGILQFAIELLCKKLWNLLHC